MSNRTVKLIANAAEFPFVYAQASRSTIDNTDPSARMPPGFSGDRANVDYGMPQLIYCENVLPTAKGLSSVSFVQQVAEITGPATTLCDQSIALRDVDENLYTFVPANGANYVLDPNTGVWTSVNPFAFAGTLVTRAYVNGRTFICYEKNRIIEYNHGTGLFTTISLTFPAGTTMADVRGIGGASNYLILFTTLAVLWCSPLNLLEFSDIDQGAGQQTPVDIKGQITALLPVAGGFIIYTTRNAIGAAFTNNANSPFVFKEVANCGGVASWERVTADTQEGQHWVWGTNGLQHVALSGAITEQPAVTDFLVGGQYEYWDATTKRVIWSDVGNAFAVKLSFLAGRYLIISYGTGATTYSHALVYDTVLLRWGRLRIDHVDCSLYTYPAGTGAYDYDDLPGFYGDLGDQTYDSLGILHLNVLAPKRGISFLTNAGAIWVMLTNLTQTPAPGVAVFGHIQERHGKHTTITDLELDGLKPATSTVTWIGSESGLERDLHVVPALAPETSGNYRRYTSRCTSRNWDLAIEGTFVLTTLLVSVQSHGYR